MTDLEARQQVRRHLPEFDLDRVPVLVGDPARVVARRQRGVLMVERLGNPTQGHTDREQVRGKRVAQVLRAAPRDIRELADPRKVTPAKRIRIGALHDAHLGARPTQLEPALRQRLAQSSRQRDAPGSPALGRTLVASARAGFIDHEVPRRVTSIASPPDASPPDRERLSLAQPRVEEQEMDEVDLGILPVAMVKTLARIRDRRRL